MKKGDMVQYIGGVHPVLVNGKHYKIYSANNTHIQVWSNTGFVGASIDEFILVKIAG